MRVFVTGATGFVGSAIVKELLGQGHEVLGLARSERSAELLKNAGASALRGDLEEPMALREGATASDAIIHAGFVHDFSRFAESAAIDRAAIEAMGAAIAGTQKPFVVTAGVAYLSAAGEIIVEADRAPPPSEHYPRASEEAVNALVARGIAASILRLPPTVHGPGDHGFVPMLIDIARRQGRSAYVGSGDNVWPAVHVADAARAYRLAVERGADPQTYHAVAEQGVPFRKIAESIAAGLGVPCVSMAAGEAAEHFGWFSGFASMSQPTSAERTRSLLGWNPEGAGLLTDIANAGYFAA